MADKLSPFGNGSRLKGTTGRIADLRIAADPARFLRTDLTRDILAIRPPNVALDSEVVRALKSTTQHFDTWAFEGEVDDADDDNDDGGDGGNDPGLGVKLSPESSGSASSSTGSGTSGSRDSLEDTVRTMIQQRGLSADIFRITQRLNQTGVGLDHTARLLLSRPPLYAYLLLRALEDEQIPPSDTTGVVQSILRNVRDLVAELYERLVINVLKATGVPIHYQRMETERLRLVNRLLQEGVPLTAGKAGPAVRQAWQHLQDTGSLADFVDRYFSERGEVAPAQVSASVKDAMVRYLQRLSVDVNAAHFTDGKYDEYFALAYAHALDVADGRSDPIDQLRSGGHTEWDFRVPHYATSDLQGIIRENIRAAGALDYIYTLGEVLGIYRLADALILRYANGRIDVPQGPVASKLYRYFKLREERMSAEERDMLYTRILMKGNAQMLQGAVLNQEFPDLWRSLMGEVVEYIEKTESDADSQVSPQPLYQAVRHLQYNLTTHMTGMALIQVTEMYAHLQDAIELLSEESIVQQLAVGRLQNMWKAVERLSQEEFGVAPNVSALRTVAVDGNKVFNFIADFDEGQVAGHDFQAFLEAAEAYILAQAESPEGAPSGGSNGAPSNNGSGMDDEMDEFAEFEDEFTDWDA